MFKKIVILFIFSLFLVSCWDDETNSNSWLIETKTENISINIPSNWKVIDNKDEILPKAKEGDIELAVMSENFVNNFSNNLLILSDELDSFVTSNDFSVLNNIWAETDYLDYTKLESKNFTFLDGEKSMIYVFEAKYNLDTPKLKFIQTAHICNWNKWYFLTIAIPTNIADTSKYEYLLSTFKCL